MRHGGKSCVTCGAEKPMSSLISVLHKGKQVGCFWSQQLGRMAFDQGSYELSASHGVSMGKR